MALLTGGTNLRLDWNRDTRKAIPTWAGGNFAFANDMTEVVLSLLLENEGWATAGRREGPSLLDVKLDTTDAPGRVRQYALRRLDLALQDGRLKSADVTVERIDRGRISVLVHFVDGRGRKDMVAIPLGAMT